MSSVAPLVLGGFAGPQGLSWGGRAIRGWDTGQDLEQAAVLRGSNGGRGLWLSVSREKQAGKRNWTAHSLSDYLCASFVQRGGRNRREGRLER